MDFSNFNAAEQAHMTRIIEKKQVSSCKISKVLLVIAFDLDARLLEALLWFGREMFQLMRE